MQLKRLIFTPFFALICCFGGDSDLPLGSHCDENRVCEEPFICLYGRCRHECTSDADCSAGELCLFDPSQPGQGACSIADETCVEDSDCEDGLVCNSDNRCHPPCVDDSDCDEGFECGPEGQCQPIDETCVVDDDDCDDGLVCGSDNRCHPPCENNSDCEIYGETYCETLEDPQICLPCMDFTGPPEICSGADRNCDGKADNSLQLMQDIVPLHEGAVAEARIDIATSGDGFGVAWVDDDQENPGASLSIAHFGTVGQPPWHFDGSYASVAVAHVGDTFGLVMKRANVNELYYGSVLDANIQSEPDTPFLNVAATSVALTQGGGRFWLAWIEEGFDAADVVRYVSFGEAGPPDDIELNVIEAHPVGEEATGLSIAWSELGIILAWQEGNPDVFLSKVHYAFLDGYGLPVGAPRILLPGTPARSEPAVTWMGTGFGIAWSEYSDTWHVYASMVEFGAQELTYTPHSVMAGDNDKRGPAVAWGDVGLATAFQWQSENIEVKAGIVSAEMDSHRDPLHFSEPARNASLPAIARGDAHFGLAWVETDVDDNDYVRLAFLDACL